MNYLFIVVIGAVAGWVAGQVVKGSEQGVAIDLAAGAFGGVAAVILSRMLGPAAASGMMISVIIAVIGAVGSLYAMRRFMKAKLVPAPRVRRRT
ncbi:MAG TPA: GlsB/YeaQ/YmgE family stress response membrane protein [Thermoanaerobaculia bacterium]